MEAELSDVAGPSSAKKPKMDVLADADKACKMSEKRQMEPVLNEYQVSSPAKSGNIHSCTDSDGAGAAESKEDVSQVLKAKTILYIVDCLDKLFSAFQLETEWEHNITLWNKLFLVFSATHRVLCNSVTGHGVFHLKFSGNQYTLDREIGEALVKGIATSHGLAYVKEEEWLGVAKEIMAYIAAFDLTMYELYYGHKTLKYGPSVSESVSTFGLYDNNFSIFLEGITFPPKIRVALAQSIGPLTILLMLHKTGLEDRETWIAAVKQVFGNFPEMDSLIAAVQTQSVSDLQRLLPLVGKLSMLIGNARKCRVFVPAAFMVHAFGTRGALRDKVGYMDYSGRGAAALYKHCGQIEWGLVLTNGNENIARQLVHHAYFKTYQEDFGVLQQMTDNKFWLVKGEIENVFKKRETIGKTVTFNLIKNVFYGTLLQEAISGVPRIESFYEGPPSIKSVESLIQIYQDYLNALVENLPESVCLGTSHWLKAEGLAMDQDGEEDTEFIAEESGSYWLS